MRCAAIDIGTNSCRLLIADYNNKVLAPVYREMVTTRIGQGVDNNHRLNPEAMDRTINCLQGFKQRMQDWGVERYRAIATSAVREAANGDEFVGQARSQNGLAVEIVDGSEEARLSYLGVQNGLVLSHPPLVVDLGGGSSEIIAEEPQLLLSLPLGAVRASEANMTAAQILDRLGPIKNIKDTFRRHPLVFTGGTATTLVSVKEGWERYDPEQVHGQILERRDIEDLYRMLAGMSLSLRSRLPGLQPERADIIPAGTLIILLIMEVLGKTRITVSENDLLQGIIWGINS